MDYRPFAVTDSSGQVDGTGIGIGHKHSSGYSAEPLHVLSVDLTGLSEGILLCEMNRF